VAPFPASPSSRVTLADAAGRWGELTVAWRQDGPTGIYPRSAYAAQVTYGTAWAAGPATPLESSSVDVSAGPVLSVIPGGVAAVFTSGSSAWAQANTGAGWPGPVAIYTDPGGFSCEAPSLAPLAGGAAVGFTCRGEARVGQFDGTAWSTAELVVPATAVTSGIVQASALASQGDDQALLAVGRDGALRMARRTGSAWSAPVELGPTPVWSELALLFDGIDFTAAWSSPGPDPVADAIRVGPLP
jgi:hypothetical protein